MPLVTLPAEMDFIIGPQVGIGTSYFDQTQVAKAKEHGLAFPVAPPTDPVVLDGVYTLSNYYDLALGEYTTHARTGDSTFLAYARKITDSWWKRPDWIGEGTVRPWPDTAVSPKFASVGGLILRALDGRPEMWDWINSYTRFVLDHWCKKRIGDATLFYGVREGAFALHYAVWLAKVLPDSFPLQAGGSATNGARLRAAYLADAEAVATGYYGALQHADGSWRWDDWDSTNADGGTYKGIMQPFMVGLLLAALCDLHQLTTNTTVKENVKNQILKACRHLYSDGPYARNLIEVNSRRAVRGFHYFYHGGTSVNPTKYAKGDLLEPWTDVEGWWLASARQAISTILPAYAYAYLISGDEFFKAAYTELYDSAYNGTDGARALMDSSPKNFNQHVRRVPASLAWIGGTIAPPPPVEPVPTTPTVRKVTWPTTEGEQDKVIAQQWAERYRFKRNLSGKFAEFEKV